MTCASVIIPCYNGGKYLGEAIESVLSQTWSDFEIIVVDDGSTDNTAEVAQGYTDPRLQYIYQANQGVATARNAGIRRSKGAYVTFLDADDLFLPQKLSTQIAYLEKHKDVGLVAGGVLRIGERGDVLFESKASRSVVSPEEVLVCSQFPVHAPLIRRIWVERVGFFDANLQGAADWDFYCRLAVLGCPMHRMDTTVCAYRFLPGAMSTDPEAQTQDMLDVVDKTFANESLPPRLKALENNARGYTHLKGAVRCYGAGLFEQGREHLAKSLEYDPTLRDDNYEKVCELMLSWAEHMKIDSPLRFFDLVFDNLPEQARDLARYRAGVINRWYYRRRKRAVQRARRRKEWCSFLVAAVLLVSCNPCRTFASLSRKLSQCLRRLPGKRSNSRA